MSPPVRTEPPFVPIRRGRWPVRLDTQRAAVASIIENASRSLSANAAPPILPG